MSADYDDIDLDGDELPAYDLTENEYLENRLEELEATYGRHQRGECDWLAGQTGAAALIALTDEIATIREQLGRANHGE